MVRSSVPSGRRWTAVGQVGGMPSAASVVNSQDRWASTVAAASRSAVIARSGAAGGLAVGFPVWSVLVTCLLRHRAGAVGAAAERT
ncbi:hypothetical protein [Actinomadura parmotrematis]|uniref:hypothetical protein n=1 Tax=Actinomadura parmotrematis TaxID=2864039 RepID=UPI00215DC131|nr:hypothetical protein [Actinomadura parmotrematis]